jgi:phage terminase large subunit
MTSAHLSIIPEFQEKIQLLESEDKFEVTKTDIINKQSGSEIIFRGLKTSSGDQTANLKSLQGVTDWVLEEAEELTEEATFDKINLSVRQKGVQNRIIIIFNPTTKEHWIYKRFFEQAGVEGGFNGVKGNVTYIHTTYEDNIEHLDQSFLDEVQRIKETNPKKYQHAILGGWLDKAEGVVFTNWQFGTFNPNGLQTSFGMDFGFSIDPDAVAEVAIDKAKKIIYVKEIIYERGLKTHVLAKLLKDKVGGGLVIAVKKGTIESGIVRMQDFQIIVDPESKNIAKEFNNYVYVNKASKLYIDDWCHQIDAIRYNIIYHLDNPNQGNYHIY